MAEGLSHVYSTRGLRGLWAGFVPSTLGVAHGAVQFAIYEKMKQRRGLQLGGREKLSNWDYIYMSGGSKLIAGAITYPYQPNRARMQQYNAASQYTGLIDVLRKTWKNEGFFAFYKGYVQSWMEKLMGMVHANIGAGLFRIRYALYPRRLLHLLYMRTRRYIYRRCLRGRKWRMRRIEDVMNKKTAYLG